MSMETLVIYHGFCNDGFAAATVYKHLVEKGASTGEALSGVEYHAGVYQQPPPDVMGKNVVMLDFSYKKPVLEQMAKDAESILIIDHHKSAQEDLVDLPENVDTVFDMDRCGCVLTWDEFESKEAPLFLKHLQDSDLGRLEMEGTEHLMSYIRSFPYDFDLYENWITTYLQKETCNMMIERGKDISRHQLKTVNELIEAGLHYVKIAWHTVPALNVPYTMASLAGKIMYERFTDCPFVATYWRTGNRWTFSLRSRRDGGADVSAVAQEYGGGGHKNAAGFASNTVNFVLSSPTGD